MFVFCVFCWASATIVLLFAAAAAADAACGKRACLLRGGSWSRISLLCAGDINETHGCARNALLV